MTPMQRERLRASLLKLRAQALSAGPSRIEPNRTDHTAAGVVDEDAQALSEMLQAISSQRNKGQAELIARIDRALRRLSQAPGEFGLCQECEEEIPLKRLHLVPYASLCAECQAKVDPRRGTTRKKLTDYR
jgi:DnaK suppressor protein